MKILVFLSLFILLIYSCKKENPKRWSLSEVYMSQVGEKYTITSSDFSSDQQLYQIESGNRLIYAERQSYKSYSGKTSKIMDIGIEIPSDIHPNSFYYSDQELYDSLKCQAFFSNSDKSNWYRINKGWIKGHFNGINWILESDVYFGLNNEYRFKIGSNY